jgi:transcription-repair coupling factor (superfamily II helicase)
MREFLQQRSNLLLCSTIIETGIDISTANTILIERADKFGLAQLHQLRGRVGRSHHQAYAYLLTPGEDALSAAAKKRLEAIQMMEELGSGFYLAMQDLEIRGAGEVLGESQSGEMQEVGFNLYADMLDHAVRSLKAGREPDLSQPFEVTTEVNLHFPALLPAAYCADVHERLVLYKRFANCDTGERLEGMQEELVDRFGDLPPAAPARQASRCGACRRDGGDHPDSVRAASAARPGGRAEARAEAQVEARRSHQASRRSRDERAARTGGRCASGAGWAQDGGAGAVGVAGSWGRGSHAALHSARRA